jgi:hypothetical protein
MGISFLGNTSDLKYWYFNIDGKTFVANNSSTLSPLQMRFTRGKIFNASPEEINRSSGAGPLVKNHSFDIITGTSQVLGPDSGYTSTLVMTGIVEWTWAGQKYRSRWTLSEGDLLYKGVTEEGEKDIYFLDMEIVLPYIPYDGPTGGAVGTGGVTNTQSPPPAAIPPIVPSLPIDQSGPVVSRPQMPAPMPFPVVSGPTPVIPPTAVTSAPTGTDWVKLGLQLGVAYFILS